MVRITRQGSVHVKIGHVNAPEYQVQRVKQGNVETTTCYIEAKEGDTFTVEAQHPAHPFGNLVTLSIDGKYVQSYTTGCTLEDRHKSTFFRGYVNSRTNNCTIYNEFAFGKMTTTSE
jgi:hypothetical protein